MSPEGVTITDKDHLYFNKLESSLGIKLDAEQRAWYCATRDTDFHGDAAKMWQEYPSTVDECFQVSNEGCYFIQQFVSARQQNRITDIPVLDSVACWTFWDIGNSDGTAIWVMQRLGNEYRLIYFYEAWGEPYSHAAHWLTNLGVTFEEHFLPHDAKHKRQGQNSNKSPQQMLQDLMPGQTFTIVPQISEINVGIQQVRDVFPMLSFDQTRCKEGIDHLESYRKKWDRLNGIWSRVPDKSGGHSESADAIRQFAQAYNGGQLNLSGHRWSDRPIKKRGIV